MAAGTAAATKAAGTATATGAETAGTDPLRPSAQLPAHLRGDTAEVVSQNILWELRKFVGMNKRTDDVTMVVAKIT